jgi:hypothetical protein
MPVSHLMITNAMQGTILYTNHFQTNHSTPEKNLVYEQLLFQSTFRTAPVKPTRTSITLLHDRHVVFQRVGEVCIFITGYDDIDEIICKFKETFLACVILTLSPLVCDIMDTVIRVIIGVINNSAITEASLINVENYG